MVHFTKPFLFGLMALSSCAHGAATIRYIEGSRGIGNGPAPVAGGKLNLTEVGPHGHGRRAAGSGKEGSRQRLVRRPQSRSNKACQTPKTTSTSIHTLSSTSVTVVPDPTSTLDSNGPEASTSTSSTDGTNPTNTSTTSLVTQVLPPVSTFTDGELTSTSAVDVETSTSDITAGTTSTSVPVETGSSDSPTTTTSSSSAEPTSTHFPPEASRTSTSLETITSDADTETSSSATMPQVTISTTSAAEISATVEPIETTTSSSSVSTTTSRVDTTSETTTKQSGVTSSTSLAGVTTSTSSTSTSSSAPAATSKTPVSVDRAGDGPYKGESTWYWLGDSGTSIGACGNYLVDSDLIAAASDLLFDKWPGATSNPNNNPICGHKARVSYGGKTVTVAIQDRCPGCAERDLDLSPSAFQQLAHLDVGRMEMTWEWVS